jgi:hypothetical protein
MSRIIIVHGEKPTRQGKMHIEFQARLEKAIRIANSGKCDLIVITGGKTRKNACSEAQMAAKYLSDKIRVPVFLEDKSSTTSENVRFAKTLIEKEKIFIDSVVVIVRKSCVAKAEHFYRHFWKEAYEKASFIGALDTHTLFYHLIAHFLFLLAVADPKEKTVFRIFKMIFRNWDPRSLEP